MRFGSIVHLTWMPIAGYRTGFYQTGCNEFKVSGREPLFNYSVNAIIFILLTLLVAGSWLPLLVAGGGGGCLGPPLISPVLTGRFLKFKRHSFCLNMIYIYKKRNFKNSWKGGIRGAKTMNFRYFFDHVLPARL